MARENEFAEIFAPFLADPTNLFVISSDFCHWGSCYSYTPYDKKYGAIHDYIKHLDTEAMKTIKTGDPDKFKAFVRNTRSTICGRYPITLFLRMMQKSQVKMKTEFVSYKQKEKCENFGDVSISFAAGVFMRK